MSDIQKFEIGTVVPEYLKDVNPCEGFDTGETPPMPQVKIIQKQSGEIDAGTAKPGDLWSDAHGGVIVPFDAKGGSLKGGPIILIPCKQTLEFMHFEKTPEKAKHPTQAGPFWRTTNPDDPRVVAMREWVNPASNQTEDHAWRARVRHVLMALPINHETVKVEAGVFTFMGASYKIGKKAFVNEAQRAVKAPLQAQAWSLDVAKEKNDDDEVFYVPVLHFAGLAPAELFKQCTETADGFGALAPQLESPKAEAPALKPVDPADDIPF